MFLRQLKIKFLALCWLFISVATTATAQEIYSISSVELVGNQRIDTTALKAQLKIKSGPISSEEISDEVKALYKTGFFDQITASIVSVGSGARVLRYSLVEKPVVRKIFIKGNKEVDEDSLRDVLNFDSRRFLDKGRIEELVKRATAIYKKKGYYDVSFDHSVAPVGENQVDLTLSVKEGRRYQIEEIRFEGLKDVDEDELISVMQTRRYKWWSSWLFGTGRLDEEMLEADRVAIRQFLLDKGYVDAVVNQAGINKKEEEFVVVFRVTEGPVYNFGKISISGDKLDKDPGAAKSAIKAESGETFSAKTVREDTFGIGDVFGDVGYAFANVVPNTQINREKHTVDINYEVNKGRMVNIHKVNIRGNSKTYDHVIRRELRVDEQETYSGKKLRRTQEILQRLGYFDEVGVSTEPVGDDQVDVNVNVKEGQTGAFSAGAGFSTAEGALFNSRISENNLFGTGRRLSLNVDVGNERDNYVFSFDDPRVADSFFSGGISAFSSERVFDDFDRNLTGASTTFGYPFEQVFGEWAEDVNASLRYEFLNIEIDDVNIDSAADLVIASEGKSTASGITPRLVRNTINNPLNPTKGSRQDISFETTGFGGDQEFYLFELRNTFFYPLVETSVGDITLSMRTTYGEGEGQGDQETLPLYRRFFAGGINSVRGYRNRALGPRDSRGNEYGGAKEFVHSTDLIFPLINAAGIRGVVFYDVGDAFDDNQNIDYAKLKAAYGIGIRWNSPLGPLRLEFGFPLDEVEGQKKSMQTQFSFGVPF
jgi:outer membrane protein insertion porin family